MHVASPPPRERITDWATEQLRAAIISGELAPGDRLSLPVLARELGVSRSPVREAVLQLIGDGLAIEQSHRGASVRVLGQADLVAAYDLREVLEGLAARRAAEGVDEPLRSDLDDIVERHAQRVASGDLDGHVHEDMAFHRRLRVATGNSMLIESLDNLQLRIQLAMRTTTVTGGPDRALADHRDIARAVIAGDADAAERLARSHIARLRGSLEP